MCVCVFLSVVSVSHKIYSSETIEIVVIIKLGMVTASDMRMYRVLIILTLTFIQGHADLNHENNKCSETVQATPIKFAVKIVRLKDYAICSQCEDLSLHSRSQLCLKLDKCYTCTIVAISRTVFLKLFMPQLGMPTDLCMAYKYAHAHFNDHDLDARS